MKEVYKGGYIIQPYAFNRLTVAGRIITKAETVILSAIYSMSVNGGRARYSYQTLSRKFRLSKSTVARCVGNLCAAGLIDQDKSNRTASTYAYVGPEVKKGALRGESYLFSEKFTYKLDIFAAPLHQISDTIYSFCFLGRDQVFLFKIGCRNPPVFGIKCECIHHIVM